MRRSDIVLKFVGGRNKGAEKSITVAPSVQRDGIAGSARHQVLLNDGVETRKLKVSELKRIGSFPDEFEFCGTYIQKWERIGNSVPPLMAEAIGRHIRSNMLVKAFQSLVAQQ